MYVVWGRVSVSMRLMCVCTPGVCMYVCVYMLLFSENFVDTVTDLMLDIIILSYESLT